MSQHNVRKVRNECSFVLDGVKGQISNSLSFQRLFIVRFLFIFLHKLACDLMEFESAQLTITKD